MTRKEIEDKLNHLINGFHKLSEDIKILSTKFAASAAIMRELTGVILTLKKKGLVSDDDITTAVTNARPKNSEGSSIQSQNSREDEDSSGCGESGLLRDKSTDSNIRSEGSETRRNGESLQDDDAGCNEAIDAGDNVG